jgi:hypothetical protein
MNFRNQFIQIISCQLEQFSFRHTGISAGPIQDPIVIAVPLKNNFLGCPAYALGVWVAFLKTPRTAW